MKVIPFRRPSTAQSGDWRPAELRDVANACSIAISRGEVSGWDVGTTEAGDPQLYLLSPAPDQDCILCVSRIAGTYVLEDGQGQIISEHDSISALVEKVRATLRQGRAAMAARVTAIGCAMRELFEEKLEPMLVEPAELLTHFAPQIAALA
jgi:hypothetical protein